MPLLVRIPTPLRRVTNGAGEVRAEGKDVAELIEHGVIPRDESIVVCITGNGLKTPDALYERLSTHATIRPTLSSFDRALADLKPQTN